MQSANFRVDGDSERPNGPYLVLGDGSTFGGLDGALVCYISEDAEEELGSVNDFKVIDPLSDRSNIDTDAGVMYVSVYELLNCWASVHGIV